MIPLGVLASSRAAAAAGLTGSYVGHTNMDNSTYGASQSVGVGAASTDRSVVVALAGRWSGTGTGINATLGGTSMAVDHYGASGEHFVAFVRLPLASGTTATLALIPIGGVWRAKSITAFVYTLVAPAGVTVQGVDSKAEGNGATTLTVPSASGGRIIAALNYGPDWTALPTWSGATGDGAVTYWNAKASASAATVGPSTAVGVTFNAYMSDYSAAVAYA